MSLQLLHTQMLSRLDETLENLGDRRVAVFGLGVVGTAICRYLRRRGALVIAVDSRSDWSDDSLRKDLGKGGEFRLGGVDAVNTFSDAELLVLSPGVDPRQPSVKAFEKAGKPIVGELELMGDLPARTTVAITGTNGKSTTTALIGAIVQDVVPSVFVGGNLGVPITTWVEQERETEIAVLELSSYQLETAYRFSPDVAIILNLAQDHAERYDSMHDYSLAKRRIIEEQSRKGIAILNYDDAVVRSMHQYTSAEIWWFSVKGPIGDRDGFFIEQGMLVGSGRFESHVSVSLVHPKLFGTHNLQNALAAFLAAEALELNVSKDWSTVLSSYHQFPGLEHRLELVATIDGVRFINDSKATNDSASAVAVKAINRPIILLAGGRDKGAGYSELLESSIGRVRHVIGFGEAGAEIGEVFSQKKEVVGAGSSVRLNLREAFVEATSLALPGDVVLLAPACSSFDEFSSYVQRGEEFKTLVNHYVAGDLQ